MTTEEEKKLHIDNISSKKTYSNNEKKAIFEKLNSERLIQQQEEEKKHIANISKKETYSDEEKQFILDRLNNDRLVQQKDEEKTSSYSTKEKDDIFGKLNENRLIKQKLDKMKHRRLHGMRKYTFLNKEYYKILGMKRAHYIEVDFCKSYSGRTMLVTIVYEVFSELKKRDVLIRTDIDSPNLFISFNALRLYFKPYTLESE